MDQKQNDPWRDQIPRQQPGSPARAFRSISGSAASASSGQRKYRSIPLGAVVAASQSTKATSSPVYRSLTTTTYDPYRSLSTRRIQDSVMRDPARALMKKPFDLRDPVKPMPAPGPYIDVTSKPTIDVAVIPPTLPVRPYTLAKYSHFYTRASPEKMVEFLNVALDKALADYEFNQAKYKWKANVYCSNKMTCASLVIRIFQTKIDSRVYAVEFQRRRGCHRSFYSLFHGIQKLGFDTDLLCCGQGNDLAVENEPKPFRDPFAVLGARTPSRVSEEYLRSLLEMADAPYTDVQIEAVREVAQLSVVAENKEPIVKAGFVQSLVQLVGSQDQDVHRCSAVALANLAETHAPKLLEFGVIESLVPRFQTAQCNFEQLEAQRACARVLATLCKSVKLGTSASVERARSELKKVHSDRSQDYRLRKQLNVLFGSAGGAIPAC